METHMDVRHLVMAVDEILERDLRALFDAEIHKIAEVPGGCRTLRVHIVWLLDDGIPPELRRHRREPEGREKLLRDLEDLRGRVALLHHLAVHVGRLRVGLDDVQDVPPVLGPHVA